MLSKLSCPVSVTQRWNLRRQVCNFCARGETFETRGIKFWISLILFSKKWIFLGWEAPRIKKRRTRERERDECVRRRKQRYSSSLGSLMWLKAEIRARPKCSIKGPCAHLEMWQINKSAGNQERVVKTLQCGEPLKFRSKFLRKISTPTQESVNKYCWFS
jgi:hypothetical protein